MLLTFKPTKLGSKVSKSELLLKHDRKWAKVSPFVEPFLPFSLTFAAFTATTTTTTNNPIGRMRANVVLKQMNSRVLVVVVALNLV